MLKNGKVAMQGGVKNYLGKKKTVTVPKDWQSSPDHPTTELAYITKAEKDLLLKKDLHNSLNGKPNRGPSGVMSLNGWGDSDGQGGSDTSGGNAGAEGGQGDGGGGNNNGGGGGWSPGAGSPGTTPDGKNKNKGGGDPEDNRQKYNVDKKTVETGPKEKDKKTVDRERYEKSKREYEEKLKADKIKADKIKADAIAKAIKEKEKEEEDAARAKELSDLGKSKTDKFGNVVKQSSLNRNKVLAMRNLNLMPKSLPGIYGNLISGITGKVPDWAKDFTEKELMQVATSGPYLSQQKTKADASRFGRGEDLLGRVFEGQSLLDENKLSQSEYERLFPSNINVDRDGGGGDNYVPPVVVTDDNTDDDDDTVNPRDYSGLGARFMGSQFDFTGLADGGIARAGYMNGGMPEYQGGIMDLETGRQQYFLGKLVKKATRAIKKVAKSPFGKVALMYGLGSLGAGALGKYQAGTGMGGKGILSKAGRYLLGTKGIDEDGGTMGLLGKFGLTGGFGGKMPTLKGGLALGLGVPTIMELMGGKEEEDGPMDLGPGIDINAIRNSPYRYLAPRFTGSQYEFADGGRIGYAEGSKEPVAKETMPLLDMDGQEMDLRAEGGFVPLGRMERADDVPARLSKNEFVFTADAVRNAGEGDIDKGAEVMYNMMKNLESGGEVSEESQGLDGAREMFQTSQRLEEVL